MTKRANDLLTQPPLPTPAKGSMTPTVPAQKQKSPTTSTPPIKFDPSSPPATGTQHNGLLSGTPTGSPGSSPSNINPGAPTGGQNANGAVPGAVPGVNPPGSGTPGVNPPGKTAPGWSGPLKIDLSGSSASSLLALLNPQNPEQRKLQESVFTETKPPGSYLTPHLGETLRGPADQALGWIQKQLSGVGPDGNPSGPQTFATYASMLGRPVVEGALATPFGLPLLAGGYGFLRGGESFAAAKHLMGPALKRMGIG